MRRKNYRPVDMRELTTVSRELTATRSQSDRVCYKRAFTFNSGPSSRERTSHQIVTPEDSSSRSLYSNRDTLSAGFGQARPASALAGDFLDPEFQDSYHSFGEPSPCIFLDSDFPPLPASDTESVVGNTRRQQRRSVTLPVPLPSLGSERSRQPSWTWATRSERPASPESTVSNGSALGHATVSEPCSREDSKVHGTVPDYFERLLRKDSVHDIEEPVIFTARYAMAYAYPQMSGDARRHFPSGSSRHENRQPMNRPTTCKNGPLCRKFQEGTCPFNHDFSSMPANGLNVPKKSFNVESPSFTPKTLAAQPANPSSSRSAGISPKAAAAATFTPRGSGTPKSNRKGQGQKAMQSSPHSGSVTPAAVSHTKMPSNEFVPQQSFQQSFQEFVPQSFVTQQQLDQQPQLSSQINAFADPFLSAQTMQLDAQQTINPYADATSTVTGQAFFPDATSFRHPLNYHLYSSWGTRREQITPYQRATSDFFIPDDLREDLQRKSEATLQTFPNSTLPQNVDNHFHSLVALDNMNQRTATVFGYPSWLYKATSSIDGNTYALRRIEGFRLTSDQAINTKIAWKKVISGNVIRVHDAFTTQAFGDRSLIVVIDYHPLSQTLQDKHFGRQAGNNRGNQITPENELWGYIVQLANALKAIHGQGLAARTVVPSKVVMTSKNRLRLSGCSVLDIVQFEQSSTLATQQQADLQDLGRLILDVATRNANAHSNVTKALELVSRTYTERLRSCLQWLLFPAQETPEGPTISADFNITTLVTNIADQVMNTFDSTLSRDDAVTDNLQKELENGRLVRLLAKLNVVLERPDSLPVSSGPQTQAQMNAMSTAWSETGERYYLKLFRDYVFHQVDHEGRAVMDLGHIVTCLNKLDAGIDERVQLMSRDEQNVFVVSYRELKRSVEAAWGELSRGGSRR